MQDKSEGKVASHQHLCTYARQHGVGGLKRVYLKAQLVEICRAYGINVQAAKNKVLITSNLVAVLTSPDVGDRIPHPELLNELRAEAVVNNGGHVVVRISRSN